MMRLAVGALALSSAVLACADAARVRAERLAHPAARVSAARAGPTAKQPYRFVGIQVAIIGPPARAGETRGFQARIHLNRRLRSDAEGAWADVRLGGASSDTPPTPFGQRSRHCYAAVIGNDFDSPGLRGAHVASAVTLTVRIRGSATLRRTVKLQRQGHADLAAMRCGKL